MNNIDLKAEMHYYIYYSVLHFSKIGINYVMRYIYISYHEMPFKADEMGDYLVK